MTKSLATKSIQYAFSNFGKYGDKNKNRIFKNVRVDAEDEAVVKVGKTLAVLMGDSLHGAMEVVKRDIEITD
ncbi:hypothetical protein GCM10022297_00200 [Lactobacillus hamsteri]|nr:hypothetical protein [Lactobacillus hamsteri]